MTTGAYRIALVAIASGLTVVLAVEVFGFYSTTIHVTSGLRMAVRTISVIAILGSVALWTRTRWGLAFVLPAYVVFAALLLWLGWETIRAHQYASCIALFWLAIQWLVPLTAVVLAFLWQKDLCRKG